MCTRLEKKGQKHIGIYMLLVLLHTLHSYIVAEVTTKDIRFQKLVGIYIITSSVFLFSFL